MQQSVQQHVDQQPVQPPVQPRPVIEVDHLNKSYGDIRAVKDLSFNVGQALCYGCLGPNGAGKTTMMKTLYGKAIPDKDPQQRLRVFGFDPGTDQLAIKARSGIVPQENSLDGELNVIQNMRIYSTLYGIPWRAAKERVDYLLDFMELRVKENARVKELSGGMQRRLTIARALLNSPSLLILDEPTTGLDPQVRQLIWDKIRSLKRAGVTVLLSTHYMDEAYQISDRILIMDHGSKVIEGGPQELLDEHMETHVLELIDTSRAQEIEGRIRNGHVRSESSGERILYYSDDLRALERMCSKLTPAQYLLRQVNLEDLFLKTTGRRLNEQQ
jgi:lipooligosaccharide transport system ATP-binding protein